MTTNTLSRENILEILELIGFNVSTTNTGYTYSINNKTFIWKKFVERYENNNPGKINQSSNDSGYIDKLLIKSSKNTTQNKEFADTFSPEKLPIVWYSDDFWTLLAMRFTCETNQYWDQKGTRSYCYADMQKTGKKILFLKAGPKENQFEGLTYFLINRSMQDSAFLTLWMDLAKRKSNQTTIKGKKIYQFILNYASCPGINSKEDIRKINALALFETEEAINEIIKIRDKNLHDAKILELANTTLKKLGEETKEVEMVLEESFGEKIKYVQEKVLNPQALIQQKLAKPNQIGDFLNLLEFYLQQSLHNKGVKFSSGWQKRWDEKISQEKAIYVLTAEMDYKYQCDETKLYIENVVKVFVHYFFKEKNQNKLSEHASDYTSKNKFYNSFIDYVDKSILKDKLEKETNNNTNPVSSRHKI